MVKLYSVEQSFAVSVMFAKFLFLIVPWRPDIFPSKWKKGMIINILKKGSRCSDN